MRPREWTGIALLGLVALAATLRGARFDPPAWAMPFFFLLALVMLGAPLVALAGAALLAPSAAQAWRSRRSARPWVVVLALLLLVPIPAMRRHCTDMRSPDDPDGCGAESATWMPLGLALATGGRIGPLDSFEHDETILTGAWAVAPLAWVAGLVVTLTAGRLLRQFRVTQT